MGVEIGADTEIVMRSCAPAVAPVAVAFALDDRMMLVCARDTVRLVAANTGDKLGALEGHQDDVTAVVVTSRVQALSSSMDGSIRIWNFCDGVCERVISLDKPIYRMVVSKDGLAAYVAVGTGFGNQVSVLSVDIASGSSKPLFETTKTSSMALSPDQTILAVVSGANLLICKLVDNSVVKHVHARDLCTVCFHPSEPYLATSDRSGRIILWYRYLEASPVVSVLHWHAHSLSALAFTDDGAYLVSGGQEAVLVLWQMETGHKHFLPRLGAPINALSMSNDTNTYALTCVDNAIRLVDAISTKPKRTIRGLVCSKYSSLVADPRSSSLIVNNNGGSLQFYDMITDAHIRRLEAFHSNTNVSVDRHDTPSRVEECAVSSNGEWMAVVLQENIGAGYFSSCLQMWLYSPSKMKYELCTRIDDAHDGHRIVAVAFDPSKNVMVTSADDHMFRVWEETGRPKVARMKPKSGTAPSRSWRCQAVGNFRGLRTGPVAFSNDGSLLAVAFEGLVTLWNPETLQIVRVLVRAPVKEEIRRVAFCGQFVVASTNKNVFVWNMLSSSLWWSARLDTKGLAVSPCGDFFATLTQSSSPSMLLFRASSSEPVASVKVGEVCKHIKNSDARSNPISFVQDPNGNISIMVLRDDNDIVRFDNVFGGAVEGISDQQSTTAPTAEEVSPLAKLYGGSAGLHQGAKDIKGSVADAAKYDQAIATLFDGASHVMPPMPALYTAFVDKIIGISTARVAEEDENVDSDVVMEKAGDEEMPASSIVEQELKVVGAWSTRAFHSIAASIFPNSESHKLEDTPVKPSAEVMSLPSPVAQPTVDASEKDAPANEGKSKKTSKKRSKVAAALEEKKIAEPEKCDIIDSKTKAAPRSKKRNEKSTSGKVTEVKADAAVSKPARASKKSRPSQSQVVEVTKADTTNVTPKKSRSSKKKQPSGVMTPRRSSRIRTDAQ